MLNTICIKFHDYRYFAILYDYGRFFVSEDQRMIFKRKDDSSEEENVVILILNL